MLTNAGKDLIYNNLAGTQAAVATSIALTANATAPAAGDTTLTGEIVTAGLARATATPAHTNGTSTYTLTKTFTATGADVPVTVQKIGVFNAASGGTMLFETALMAPATLSAAGDQLVLTETVTLS